MRISESDCLILCGGLGKRLKSVVSDVPKVMAEIKGRPFMDYIIEYVKRQGIERIILCTGYKADVIESYYREHTHGMTIDFSREHEPLGTGGAIKNARGIIESDPFCVLNGDSFSKVDLGALLAFHAKKQSALTVAVSSVEDGKDFGSIAIGENSEVLSFDEKSEDAGKSSVNAGVYCMNQSAFDLMPQSAAFSLESDFFPAMINRKFYGFKVDHEFMDIGTPERYESARDKLK